jgi:PTHB1 C-terminus
VQGSQTRLKKLSGDLSCLSRIMALVATLKCGLSDPERFLLESYLCPDLQGGGGAGGGSDQGCEEAMDASLTYLLKTSLAKNAKENAIIHSSALEVRLDILINSC